MTISQEFREKIRAGKYKEALILALTESVDLKVTTWIASDNTDEKVSEDYLCTEVNLVEGEITNSIGANILENPAYQELCKLHFEQVQQGQQIIFNNLKSLQAMLTFLEQNYHPDSKELPGNPRASLPFQENSTYDS